MFDPDSTGKACWEVAGLFFIIYQSLFIPYRICFDAHAEGFLEYVEFIIDVCFILDIFVNFNTSFYKKGNLITARKEIVKNYLLTWFLIDCLASFPYNLLIDEDLVHGVGDMSKADQEAMLRTPQLLKLMKLARFLRFLRLLRVFKLKQILYKIEEMIADGPLIPTINLMKVVCFVIFMGHWLACIFFAIGSS